MTWFEFDKARLVLECARVKRKYPDFTLKRDGQELYWEGWITVLLRGVQAEPLHLKVTYPEGFPAVLPSVESLSPKLDPKEVGHSWHRWPDGSICFVRPPDWNISSTADEVITKAADWYFNYVAVKRGLVSKMPDFGRADVQTDIQGA